MKLRQLQYVVEVVNQGLNITNAAESLHTAQPGISNQIKSLEEELGVSLFERNGKHITRLTRAGEDLVEHFSRVLDEIEVIEKTAADHANPSRGSLTIATTHTQARYVLPDIITQFVEKYPDVALHIHQGTPTQIAEMAATGVADVAIATEALELFDGLCLLPCYRWNRCVMVPKGHPLVKEKLLTLDAVSQYSIITYVFGVADRSIINQAFVERGLDFNVVLTAADAEVIKTYVRNGLGVGLVARMAYDRKQDQDLQVLDAGHLFEESITSLAIRKNVGLRDYMFDFIEMFSPHLKREVVEKVMDVNDNKLQQALFDEHVANTETR
ncbi:MAG: HTH-type transcriptional regulator CysB [Proteobacteria bacterium]|jgi:LysR family transcriptional regulator, cys regulon transcriptional activator|nr:HTH-type transcriptional regulator CysB [Pseudomonadota bacterium]